MNIIKRKLRKILAVIKNTKENNLVSFVKIITFATLTLYGYAIIFQDFLGMSTVYAEQYSAAKAMINFGKTCHGNKCAVTKEGLTRLAMQRVSDYHYINAVNPGIKNIKSMDENIMLKSAKDVWRDFFPKDDMKFVKGVKSSTQLYNNFILIGKEKYYFTTADPRTAKLVEGSCNIVGQVINISGDAITAANNRGSLPKEVIANNTWITQFDNNFINKLFGSNGVCKSLSRGCGQHTVLAQYKDKHLVMNVFTSNDKIKYCTGSCGKYGILQPFAVEVDHLLNIKRNVGEQHQFIRESSIIILKEFSTLEEAKTFLENNFNVSNVGNLDRLQRPYNLNELVNKNNSNVNKELAEKFSNDIVKFLSDNEKINANNTLFFDPETQKLIELDSKGNPIIREVIHDHDGIHCVNNTK